MDDSFDQEIANLDFTELLEQESQNKSTQSIPSSNKSTPSQKEIEFIKSKLIKPGTSKEKKECMFVLKNPEDIKDEEDDKTVPKRNISSHCLLVSPKQKGNPLLKAISNIPWEIDDIIPDYQMSNSSCALFLSLKYHNLNPDYIHERLKKLGKRYELRVLLTLIDIEDPHQPLKHLSRICILADLTLMLAWTFEEAGKIIETYKIYENKPPDIIKEKSEEYPYLKLVQALTSIKPINKTDAMTLITKFGTLKNIIEATEYQLSSCPGFGQRKAKKLYSVLHENFCK